MITKKILLDTNVYGRIVLDEERELVHNKIHSSSDILIFGFVIVRKELRATERMIVNINLKADLLRVYDDLVKKTYSLESKMEKLAEEYYEAYSKFGGTTPKSKLINDLLIVACASVKDLNVVVSDDARTMFGELAVKAYQFVNKLKKYPLPGFLSYGEFKDVLKK